MIIRDKSHTSLIGLKERRKRMEGGRIENTYNLKMRGKERVSELRDSINKWGELVGMKRKFIEKGIF